MIGYENDIRNSNFPTSNDASNTDNVVFKKDMTINNTLQLTSYSSPGKFTTESQTKYFYLKWSHTKGVIPKNSDGEEEKDYMIDTESSSTRQSCVFNSGWRRSWIGTVSSLTNISNNNIWNTTNCYIENSRKFISFNI